MTRGMIHAVTALCTAFLLLASGTGCAAVAGQRPAPGSPGRERIEQLLGAVRVVAQRPHPGGYERGCGARQNCVFGPAWSDDHDGPGGRDGCDTRNNVLARQLTGVGYRPGTHRCVVQSGTLADPYTGALIVFSKETARRIPIDHIYPLAAAWDFGAAGWPPAQRIRFANDIDYNLQATDDAANTDKSDSTPADWLPPARSGHCYYAGRYLTVALRYQLPVTAADHAALRRIAGTCG
ncbi:HNH endonuclease family protein [Nocardia sp. NBC_01329]|uniref:HNH endonuclease family protein n=1 Tax=Nocardia sp. NBC_01329 TaxID=2903594 RepID=UPI002E0FB492|nr:HNH endonuclease family protein [Nocardia sp. NBC_01329]